MVTGNTEVDRGNWTGKLDFIMSLLAYCVGLGNVWRFPYLCFRNGGGAFLIPYVLCWALTAVPLFFLEIAIGQNLRSGGINLWNVCPLFKGVGFASILMSTYCNIYYTGMIVWSLFFFFSSFSKQLPWTNCGHWWNNDRCREANFSIPDLNRTDLLANWAANGSNASFTALMTTNASDFETPVAQFWERRVLRASEDIFSGPAVVWELAGIMLLVWFLSYFALWRGITRLKKIIYVCAILPYILLFILLVRAVTLEGASTGMYYYLKPNMSKILETSVWRDAGTQVFYSYGIGFGVLSALGSYNKFNHNCLRDAVLICCVNGATSFLAGSVVFSVLGHMATISGKTMEAVAKSGPGLVFQAYPEVVATMAVPQLWAVVFFLMLVILGLDTQVGNIEGVVTALSDVFPVLRKRKKLFVLALCISHGLLAFPYVTRAGNHWVTFIDAFGASGFTLMIIVFAQIIGLAYGYGAEKIFSSLHKMLGFRPSRMWLYLWKYIAPIGIFINFLFVSIKYEPLEDPNGRVFADGVQILGFVIAASSVILIPGWAVYYTLKQPGTSLFEKLKQAREPLVPETGEDQVESSEQLLDMPEK